MGSPPRGPEAASVYLLFSCQGTVLNKLLAFFQALKQALYVCCQHKYKKDHAQEWHLFLKGLEIGL